MGVYLNSLCRDVKLFISNTSITYILCTSTPGRDTPVEEDPETTASRAKVYKSAYRLVSTYWVLVVLGAFLLVTLAGRPSLLKTVYLVFFFLFMITYQVGPIFIWLSLEYTVVPFFELGGWYVCVTSLVNSIVS